MTRTAKVSETPQPLVSIIIPSYNQGTFIRHAIESCLRQDYRPLEILVLDGASRDRTVDILHEYDRIPEVRWISEPDNGVVEAVNKGFQLARGQIAGIQSSDDGYLPGAVSEAVREFLEAPDLGLVYGDWIYVDAEGEEKKRHQTGPFSLENFLCGNTLIMQPVTFFRLPLARKIGGWNPDYFVADTEMWLRMVFCTHAKKVDRFWGIRRLHEDQRNTRAAEIFSSYARMIDASPDIGRCFPRLRRAAKAGKYIMSAGYNPSGSAFKRYIDYWRAVFYHPSVFKAQKLGGVLIPGYWYLYRWYRFFLRGIKKTSRYL